MGDGKVRFINRSNCLVLLTLLMITCFAGCRKFDSAAAIQKMNATKPQQLANLYAAYQLENGSRGPKNEAVFQAYIKKKNPVLLERIGVDPNEVVALFTSDRDGEPFKIRYGVNGNDRSPPKPVIFEESGVDGVRVVAFTKLKVEEVADDAEYKKLFSEK